MTKGRMRLNTTSTGLHAGPNFLQQPRKTVMKKTAVIFAMLLASSFMLTACASKYIAVTKDYAVYIGTKKPVIDPANDSVSFEDENGNVHTMPREDLKQIRPL